ncbi:MAG: Omp28-related outer membrane protein [Candidatus Cryptobacteroides sp.]
MAKRYSRILAALLVGLGVISCDSAENTTIDEGPIGELTLSLDNTIILADGVNAAHLIVKAGDEVVTDYSAISVYRIDKDNKSVLIQVPELAFTTTSPGSYTFWVSYKSRLSNKVSLVAVSPSVEIPGLPADPEPTNLDFRKRVLITQFTGTGCGYCPYMILLLRNFMAQDSYKEKTVLAACHTYNSSDPMYLSKYTSVAKDISSLGYPSVMLNLNTGTASNTPALSVFNKTVDNEYAVKALAGICAASVADELSFVVKSGIKVSQTGKYFISAWLLEDGITATQTSYSVPGDFSTHDNAVRDILGYNSTRNDYLGFEYYVQAGDFVNHEFQFTIQDDWKIENTHVVVYVCCLNGERYTVNNVIDIRPNETIPFEYEN